jgi:GxxExxY protein
MNEDELSKKIIGCAIEVHRTLGAGLLESVYEHALFHELKLSGLNAERQIEVPVNYKGINCGLGFRMDLLVEKIVIIELKSVNAMHEVYLAQTLSYLRLTNIKLALLINFNVPILKRGIKRVVNNL